MCFYVKLPYNIGNIVSWAVKVAEIGKRQQLKVQLSVSVPSSKSQSNITRQSGKVAAFCVCWGKSNLLICLRLLPMPMSLTILPFTLTHYVRIYLKSFGPRSVCLICDMTSISGGALICWAAFNVVILWPAHTSFCIEFHTFPYAALYVFMAEGNRAFISWSTAASARRRS